MPIKPPPPPPPLPCLRLDSLTVHVNKCWPQFNRRAKKQDKSILEQGLRINTADERPPAVIPPPMTRPTSPIRVPVSQQHRFTLPPNTAGQSPTRKQRQHTKVSPKNTTQTVKKSSQLEIPHPVPVPVRSPPPLPVPVSISVTLPVSAPLPVPTPHMIHTPLPVSAQLPVSMPLTVPFLLPPPVQVPLPVGSIHGLPTAQLPISVTCQPPRYVAILPGVSQQPALQSAMAPSLKSYYKRQLSAWTQRSL
ncbi:ras-associated and pleckstrin homology domains-containing protein 1-like [Pecten maximus]|uniref:ras-associated and pleckstrin homology domains-containing protein 1-like n=1 Tax=Pecten maximus TaxID=6579 RepID=UPI001458799A|nr:ras-associated and pleckstrin homology domains-containing protein 1-like [Pecten maximus]